MILEYSYTMKQNYGRTVANHHFSIRCIPPTTERQRIISTQLTVAPECRLSYKADVFGNKSAYGCIKNEHNSFTVCLTGTVETGLSCCENKETAKSFFCDIFRIQSAFTQPGAELRRLYAMHEGHLKQLDSYSAALYLMRTVYHTMSYTPGATNVSTNAEQAMLKRCGVCQDYAHILISLCRMCNIPARYVVGMMIGEGASHAWVEVCCCGFWYGLDPTNNLLVDENYIKLSYGRDYADTIVLKGMFCGFTSQTQDISVIVTPINKEGTVK